MIYRTKTYIAADWDGDRDAVEQLYRWNDNKHLNLSFSNAHDLTQARDSSLNCNIKKSLKRRMDASKLFVLIVGKKTKDLRAGSCQYCSKYSSYTHLCDTLNNTDDRSYIDYECQKALEAGIKIVVLYNSKYVLKDKCPKSIRYVGTHIPMIFSSNGELYWNYMEIKKALND